MILEELTEAIERSDVGWINGMKQTIKDYADPWQIHLSLYPAVQRVLNPPFINPHLPKMYNICRQFVPHLSREGMCSLVYLETVEYARRAKLVEMPVVPPPGVEVTFSDIEKAIAANDRVEAWVLLSAFLVQKGQEELLRRLLLLGSGYLNQSLGHSISCTAFILLESIERKGIDAASALWLLADYFCKGGFHATPPLKVVGDATSVRDLLSRAVNGSGFIDIHHTITLYAIEWVRSFFTSEEHDHMLSQWLDFIGDKPASPLTFSSSQRLEDYGSFYSSFSRFDERLMLDLAAGMIDTPADRARLCGFLCTAVCDLYQGTYKTVDYIHYLVKITYVQAATTAFLPMPAALSLRAPV